MNKVKVIRLVGVSVFLILILFVAIYNKSSDNEQIKSLNLLNYNFEERACVFSENEFIVGNSVPQIENNYWDFKFTKVSDTVIKISINKLWYGDYDDTILDIGYLNEVCVYIKEIAKASNVELENEELIVERIQQDYLKIKQGESVNKILEYTIVLDKANLSLERVETSE